mmetsp:Transcript_35909/g.84969  ORF Transcript_35909/g.84969 Transcript_35909/m.84969 type:complete len:277 (-) Transcript_35909:121-951(-)
MQVLQKDSAEVLFARQGGPQHAALPVFRDAPRQARGDAPHCHVQHFRHGPDHSPPLRSQGVYGGADGTRIREAECDCDLQGFGLQGEAGQPATGARAQETLDGPDAVGRGVPAVDRGDGLLTASGGARPRYEQEQEPRQGDRREPPEENQAQGAPAENRVPDDPKRPQGQDSHLHLPRRRRRLVITTDGRGRDSSLGARNLLLGDHRLPPVLQQEEDCRELLQGLPLRPQGDIRGADRRVCHAVPQVHRFDYFLTRRGAKAFSAGGAIGAIRRRGS